MSRFVFVFFSLHFPVFPFGGVPKLARMMKLLWDPLSSVWRRATGVKVLGVEKCRCSGFFGAQRCVQWHIDPSTCCQRKKSPFEPPDMYEDNVKQWDMYHIKGWSPNFLHQGLLSIKEENMKAISRPKKHGTLRTCRNRNRVGIIGRSAMWCGMTTSEKTLLFPLLATKIARRAKTCCQLRRKTTLSENAKEETKVEGSNLQKKLEALHQGYWLWFFFEFMAQGPGQPFSPIFF